MKNSKNYVLADGIDFVNYFQFEMDVIIFVMENFEWNL